MPEKLTEEVLREQLGTKFRVALELEGAPEVELELDEVAPFPQISHSRGDLERFSAYFYGPGNFYLPQNIYKLEHEQLGENELFLVPIAQDQRGYRYEAVFSRFKDE